jgi:hypothetical protein
VIQTAPALPTPVVKTQTESHPETIKPSVTLPRTQNMKWAVWAALAIVAGLGIWFAASRLRSLPATAVPVLNPSGGTYAAVQPVTISDATPGASIHYTVNGSTPTTDSPVYTGPIASLPSGTMVRAMAAADGHAPSSDIAGVYNWSAAVRNSAKPASGLSISIPSIPQTVIDNATHGQTVVPPTPTPSSDLTAEQLRAKAYVLMGQEKMKAKDYVSAENNFKMALNLDPDNATAEKGLAAAKKALGN